MYRYVIKRVLFLIPTILGVIFIILLTMNFTPGDPARALLGVSAPQADVDTLNHELGYDLPFTQNNIIARVLPGEVESTLPFDADELVFDFFPISQLEKETKILSAAIKKEHITTLLNRLKLMHIDPIIIAPTALTFHHLLALWPDPQEIEAQR